MHSNRHLKCLHDSVTTLHRKLDGERVVYRLLQAGDSTTENMARGITLTGPSSAKP